MERIGIMSLWMARFIFIPLIQFIAALGGAIFVTGSTALHAAALQAHFAVANDGPTPTSMTTANMPQARYSVHYNKEFMKWLAIKFQMLKLCTRMTMPEKSGLTFRNFMLSPLGPNTNNQQEGYVGSPVTVNALFRDIVMGQLADYLNFSDLTWMTSISDDMVNYRRMLAYRLAYSLDNIIMLFFDYLRTLDANTANQDSTVGPLYPFSKQIIEQMPFSLQGQNISPMKTGYFYGKIHPFFVGDMFALDNSNNSLVDIAKHTPEGQAKLEELADMEDGDQPIKMLELFGCRWLPSTNCTQTAAWQGSGLTALSTYLAGEDAMVFVNMPSGNHTDPGVKWMNMNLRSGEYAFSAFDPPGVVKAGAAYNCIYGVGPTPDSVSRARIAKAVPQTT